MQVLIVGGGGREHALAWKLMQSPAVTQIFCAPGNGGIRLMPKGRALPLAATDMEGLLRFATVQGVGLTIVGPELPLVQGICDRFRAAGLPIFGPSQEASRLEGSKAWAKKLLQEAGISTAPFAIFQELEPALQYLHNHPLPVVIKADGLAGGKGVTIAQTLEEAETAVEGLLKGKLGPAGQTVVIEEFLPGEEASLLLLCDGKSYGIMPPAQDYKRLGAGDTGPNTGGMGAYAPATRVVPPELVSKICHQIIDPLLQHLRSCGIVYQGVLYLGLMIDSNGNPSVLEFNCRLGDPETQVLMPLLQTPLDQVLLACVEGRLSEIDIQWSSRTSACVVMASQGYPESYERGKPISGLEKVADTGAHVFHAGTRLSVPLLPGQSPASARVLTDGGRVLCITGEGDTLAEALQTAYAGVQQIHFEGVYYRRDIGFRELGSSALETILSSSGSGY